MICTNNLFRLLSLSFVFCLFTSNKSFAQDAGGDAEVVAQQDTIVSEPSKTIHFLDGEQVSESVIAEKASKGEIEGRGYTDSRIAIRMYGEKYRYGAIFWNSKGTN